MLIWKTSNGKLYKQLDLPRSSVSASAFSADNKYLLTGLSRESLILWRLKSADPIKKWRPARRYFWQSSLARVTDVAFINKKYLLSVTSRGIAQKWKYR